ncbi:MAG TPA: saccharopine dehydrogenase NADP-binding domain-containing protein [Solirubrobacteraceae bacterium]|nr:saccharopine dehydrogenase NADP-binding domain-containing protein [Solirubrobacteraceae bacterium]
MAPRIVLFGATGYTGRLTAHALVEQGARPLLAGRNQSALEQLAGELSGLETAVADVAAPDTVQALVQRGDVLVSTVGPFTRWGEPAVRAAIAAGASYLDSTGETPFIRQVFERYGAGAEAAGCGLVTAFGYDWVPGNLAGALALQQAGDAVRVDIGYFFSGLAAAGMSGGTRASVVEALLEPAFAWRGGRIVTERGAKHVRSFELAGKQRQAISVGTTEHFALPRVAPQLRDVNVYLGWFGPLSRPLQALTLATGLPGAASALRTAGRRLTHGSSGGPSAEKRAQSGSHIVAIASSAAGDELARVDLTGGNGYDFTAAILAWGARTALVGGLKGSGALGPVDGFGLEQLRDGCAQAGLSVS